MDDFDRPLNDRGNHDAPMMAKKMVKRNIKIDTFISSPANRAFTTAVFFAKDFDQKQKQIIQVPELYEAVADVFYKVVCKIDPSTKTAALFSHNPGITDFANSLTKVRLDNIPTCGVFAVKADIKSWADFTEAEKEFWFFDCPKAES